MLTADDLRAVAALLRGTGEHGSHHAALMVDQLADEIESPDPAATSPTP